MAEQKTIHLKIRRQDGPDKPSRWEAFNIPYREKLNVISCLMEIQKNPITAEGKKTTPVVWECNCLEEVCGACTMNINGQGKQALLCFNRSFGTADCPRTADKIPIDTGSHG